MSVIYLYTAGFVKDFFTQLLLFYTVSPISQISQISTKVLQYKISSIQLVLYRLPYHLPPFFLLGCNSCISLGSQRPALRTGVYVVFFIFIFLLCGSYPQMSKHKPFTSYVIVSANTLHQLPPHIIIFIISYSILYLLHILRISLLFFSEYPYTINSAILISCLAYLSKICLINHISLTPYPFYYAVGK